MTPKQIAAVERLIALGVSPDVAAASVSSAPKTTKPRSPEYLERKAAKAREARAKGPTRGSREPSYPIPTGAPEGLPVLPSEPPGFGTVVAPRASDLLSDLPEISKISALPLSTEIDKSQGGFAREGSGESPSIEAPQKAPKAARSGKAPKGKTTTAPPSDATDEEVRAWLVRWALPPLDDATEGLEVQRFLDRNRAAGGAYIDWSAAWRNWLRNRAAFAASRAMPRQSQEPDEPWKLPEHHPGFRLRHTCFTEEDRAQEWRKRPPKPVEYMPAPTKRPPFDPDADKALRAMGVDVEKIHREQNAYWDKREADEAAAAAKAEITTEETGT